MLRTFLRKAVCRIVVLAFSSHAILAADGRQVVGRIVSSSGASVGGVPVPVQGTVLAGDSVTTAKGGSAIVKISANTQVTLAEATTVSFSIVSGHPLGKISAGILLAETDGAGSLSIETPRCRIAAVRTGKTSYLVSVLADGSTMVTARHGATSISEISSGENKTLPEGETAACAAPSSALPGQEKEQPKPAPGEPAGQAPPKPPAPHHGSGILILVGVAAAAGIGAAVAASSKGAPASPSAP